MNRVAVIQARMGSSRLPGKTLMRAGGKPLLQHLIERLKKSSKVDRIIVATTTQPEDQAIETLCSHLGIGCFRGSSEDVLDRVESALRHSQADLHIEIHGDGPLLDWRVIDRAVDIYESHSYDLVTNALTVTYSPGLEVWVYKPALLTQLKTLSLDRAHCESPCLYLIEHPERYSLHNFTAPPALHAPETYLEVDTAEDFTVLQSILDALVPSNPEFTTEDILRYLADHPDLAAKNRMVERRWKTLLHPKS